MESPSEQARIVLSLVGSGDPPRIWTSSGHLRLGRLPELEVSLDDLSVSRLHAEVYLLDDDWVVRDRGSSNGTILNGVRIGRTPQPVKASDTIQIGNLVFKVDRVQRRPVTVRLGNKTVQVEAAVRRLPEPFPTVVPDPPPGRNLRDVLRLVRSAHRLVEAPKVADALQDLMTATLDCFGARRVAVFMFDDATGQLAVQSCAARTGRAPGKTLAAVALRRRQSLLFADRIEAAKYQAESAVAGDLNSVICAVLRAPDREFGVLHLDRGTDADPFTTADLELADTLADALALGLDRQQLIDRNRALFVQTVTALAQAVEMRDEYTGNHTQRVTTYALLLADEMGLPDEDRRQLQVATLLHDIGKIGIDDDILRKPGRLSDAEFAQMRTHVVRGAEIVQMIPGLAWALPVVRGHHERWDGRGYPDGLKGEQIPLSARVVAVADAFDAMTSDRPYRAGMPTARAFAELQAGSGTHFDPACVDAFVRIRPRLEVLLERAAAELRDAETGHDTLSRQELERQRAAVLAEAASSALRNTLEKVATGGR